MRKFVILWFENHNPISSVTGPNWQQITLQALFFSPDPPTLNYPPCVYY